MYQISLERRLSRGTLAFVGIEKYHVDHILDLQHYRKNKRVLFSLAGAMSIRIGEVVLEQVPKIVDTLGCIMDGLAEPDSASDGAIEGLVEEARGVMTRAIADYERSPLRLTEFVTRETLAVGAALREGAEDLSRTSPNAQLYIQVLCLERVLPYCGFYVTHRAGQTDCPDVFWHYMNNVLFATTKCNYQELALNYSFLKFSMPLTMLHDIYELQQGPSGEVQPGAWAVTTKNIANVFACLHNDEALESGINNKLKMIRIRQDVSSLERSIN